jgi:predicted phosphodiesterase
MRYAIFADIHANLEALEAVLAACKGEGIDEYLCVGDIVGYAADPDECIEKLKTQGVISVAGNHDWAAVKLFSIEYFNPLARQAILWTHDILSMEHREFLENLKLVFVNRDLTLVHGTLNYPKDFNYLSDGYLAEETFRIQKTPVCFVGHTHVPGVFIKDSNGTIHYRMDNLVAFEKTSSYIVNVGSVGQPRDANPKAAYCIYDSRKKQVSIRRVSYDIYSANDKILSAGLPIFLGERLFLGK